MPIVPELDDFVGYNVEISGSWIALAPNTYTMIASGHTLVEAEHAARVKGVEHPMYLKLAPTDGVFIPGAAV